MERVRSAAGRYPTDPFLLTVTADGAPHCSPVPVRWAGERLVVPAPRHWARHPPAERGPSRPRPVGLLYPPTEANGYSLVIDGTTDDAGPMLTLAVTRAVLHRRAHPDDATSGPGCRSDCIQLVPEA